VFARKNYFYPDPPRGYQISQYELPLATERRLDVDVDGAKKFVHLTRIHMEEDAGKSLHEGFADSDRKTYLDYNAAAARTADRNPCPEPDMRSRKRPRTLRAAAPDPGVGWRERRQHGGGSLRCDANVSVRPTGTTTLGTKTEVKNVNSFRHLQKAIEYEIDRHVDVIEHGGRIVQETRLFDAAQARPTRCGARKRLTTTAISRSRTSRPWWSKTFGATRCGPPCPNCPRREAPASRIQYGLPAYDAELLTQDARAATTLKRRHHGREPQAAATG